MCIRDRLKWELKSHCVCVHLTYVPFIAAAKEYKTKPTQHSVKQLQEEGIQPDILVLRTEHKLSDEPVSYTHLVKYIGTMLSTSSVTKT